MYIYIHIQEEEKGHRTPMIIQVRVRWRSAGVCTCTSRFLAIQRRTAAKTNDGLRAEPIYRDHCRLNTRP